MFRIACQEGGLLVTGDTYNYLLLNGGKLQVNDHVAFFQLYAEHMPNVFVVQMRTPVFKFFVDFDYEGDIELSKIDYTEVAKVFHQHLCILFEGKEKNDMIVCNSSTPKVKKNKKIHTGLHFHWPDVLVDSAMAKLVRQHIILAISEEFGDIFGMFDESVYKSNGLRMKGSMKSYTDKRTYWPNFIISKDGTITQFTGDHLSAIQQTSIRSDAEQPDKISVENLVVEVPDEDYEEIVNGPKQLPALHKWKGNDTITERCQRAILMNFPILKEQCSNFRVTDVTRFGESDTRFGKTVALARTNCTYCTNKEGHHQNSTIYFVIKKEYMVQRCFCHKDFNGQLCRTFRSPQQNLQISDVKDLLFSPGTETKAGKRRLNHSSYYEDLLKVKF
jgi:hypothetical protein